MFGKALLAALSAGLVGMTGGSFFELDATTIEGKSVGMREYRGKVVLVVNTASKCGLTPQYEELQALYDRHKEKGFVVIGFPSNQFGNQEPGTEKEIQEFCTKNFKVTFPMMSKIDVNGPNRHKIYQFLIENSKTPEAPIAWNFEKFLVNREGQVIGRFGPRVKPSSEEIAGAVKAALSEGR